MVRESAETRTTGEAGRFAGAGRPVARIEIVSRESNAVKWIRDFYTDQEGQDAVEMSLLLVLIGVAGLFVLSAMGQSVTEIFSKINTKVADANNSIPE